MCNKSVYSCPCSCSHYSYEYKKLQYLIRKTTVYMQRLNIFRTKFFCVFRDNSFVLIICQKSYM
jgi:hypothetical protein